MIHRRTALGLLAGAAAGASVLPAAAQAAGAGQANTAFDPANPGHVALAFRKLAYSMDDTLTFWWMRGTRYGVQGSVATPFWDMYVAAWFTTRDLADGHYEVKLASANFYTAPGAGTTLLEKFANPYTGKTVDVPYNKPRATVVAYDRKGGSPFGSMNMPGMTTTRQTDFGPAWLVGDELMVQGDLVLHAEPQDRTRRSFTVNDWSTYVGSPAAVLDPKVTNPPSQQMFTDVLDYPPWLQMGDQPGTYVSRCYGRKVFDYASMPATWRALFEQKFPEVAKDPGAVLRG